MVMMRLSVSFLMLIAGFLLAGGDCNVLPAQELAAKELFQVFHVETDRSHRDPGVVMVRRTGTTSSLRWEIPPWTASIFQVIRSWWRPDNFSETFAGTQRSKRSSGVRDGKVKVTIEETFPEKCAAHAICCCSILAGLPPPIGNTVIAIQVDKHVTSAEVETVSVIAKCCLGTH
jgi:hypothetical protein